MSEAKRKRMEPPGWWKRWRPLRWLAALIVLVALVTGIKSLFAPHDDAWVNVEAPAPVEPAAVAPTEASAAEIPQAAVAPAADIAQEPDPAPAAAAAPAVAATPVVPAAVTAPAAAAAEKSEAVAAIPVQSPPATVGADTAVFEEEEEAQPPPTLDEKAYTAIAPNRVMLMGMFKSYSGVDEIHRQLSAKGEEPTLQSNHAPKRAGIPPRELDVLRKKPYRHLGVDGTLELQFFNDRLYQAEFEPDDADAYSVAVRKALPQLKRAKSGRSELRDGPLRIASSVDLAVSDVGQSLRTRPFVLWQDVRLVQQRDAWDYRYAQKAVE